MNRRAVAYARVSSAEQLREGFSVPAQWQIIKSYAREKQIAIVKEFSDDETAKEAGRSDFSRMLAYLVLHPDCALIVEKVDRLYRNEDDYFTLRQMGTELHFVKEGGPVPTNADGKFMHRLRVALAQKYVENLSEEVKKGMRRKCEEGGWPTWAPLGYRNVKDAALKKECGGIVQDEKAPLVAELFAAGAAGSSYADLVRLARKIGLSNRKGTAITPPTLIHVVSNIAYTGWFAWGLGAERKTYRGKYQPLISESLYEAAQRALRARSKPKLARHVFTYAGMIQCASCGGLMSGDRKKDRYVYYFCGGKADCKLYMPESIFEAVAIETLQSLVVDEDVSAWVVEQMARWFDGAAAKNADAIGRIEKRLTEIQSLRAKCYEDKLLGRVDEEEWRSLSDGWKDEAAGLEARRFAMRPAMERGAFLRTARRPFELAQLAANQYGGWNAEEKSRLLRIITSNFTVVNGTVYVSMRSPFDILLECRDRIDWLTRLDEFRTGLFRIAA